MLTHKQGCALQLESPRAPSRRVSSPSLPPRGTSTPTGSSFWASKLHQRRVHDISTSTSASASASARFAPPQTRMLRVIQPSLHLPTQSLSVGHFPRPYGTVPGKSPPPSSSTYAVDRSSSPPRRCPPSSPVGPAPARLQCINSDNGFRASVRGNLFLHLRICSPPSPASQSAAQNLLTKERRPEPYRDPTMAHGRNVSKQRGSLGLVG